MQQTLQTFKILFLALVLAGGLQYAVAAWGGPTAMPPGNNAPAPINVSGAYQEKEGGFFAVAGGVFSGNGVWANQYCDLFGNNCSSITELLDKGEKGTLSCTVRSREVRNREQARISCGSGEIATGGASWRRGCGTFIGESLNNNSYTVRWEGCGNYGMQVQCCTIE